MHAQKIEERRRLALAGLRLLLVHRSLALLVGDLVVLGPEPGLLLVGQGLVGDDRLGLAAHEGRQQGGARESSHPVTSGG